MINEARDICTRQCGVAQKPVAMPRFRLPEFKTWLAGRDWRILSGRDWRIDGTIGDWELVRAWRPGRGGSLHLFVYDSPDPTNVMLFDIAAREADQFLTSYVDTGGSL